MSVSIANKALRRVHARPILALDGSDETRRMVREELECAVDYVARRHGWSELTSLYCPQKLPEEECTIPNGFCFAYHLPRDYIRVRRVEIKSDDKKCPDLGRVQWRILKIDGCDVLVTDCDPVNVEYVCRPDLDALDGLSADLKDAIRLRLAMQIVQPLNADKSMYAEIEAEFERAMRHAIGASEEQDHEDHFLDYDGELLEGRLCAWSNGPFYR